MTSPPPSMLSGDDLKRVAQQFLQKLQAENSAKPTNTLSLFNKWFVRVMTRLLSMDPNQSWEQSVNQILMRDPQESNTLGWDFLRLTLFLDRWQQGRFVTYEQRQLSAIHYFPKYGTEFGSDVLLTCQGAPDFIQWRGKPLMKTVFDFAIYPQLVEELNPKTIFEIGSGHGTSALWLSDTMRALNKATKIHSVDIMSVQQTYEDVAFYQGDCHQPESLFPKMLLETSLHPWLVIEDAHQNVEKVLSYLHMYLKQGDYLYVEDSEVKRDAIKGFLSRYPDFYLIDTKYTDFFGRNATCALDSIFIKIKD